MKLSDSSLIKKKFFLMSGLFVKKGYENILTEQVFSLAERDCKKEHVELNNSSDPLELKMIRSKQIQNKYFESNAIIKDGELYDDKDLKERFLKNNLEKIKNDFVNFLENDFEIITNLSNEDLKLSIFFNLFMTKYRFYHGEIRNCLNSKNTKIVFDFMENIHMFLKRENRKCFSTRDCLLLNINAFKYKNIFEKAIEYNLFSTEIKINFYTYLFENVEATEKANVIRVFEKLVFKTPQENIEIIANYFE